MSIDLHTHSTFSDGTSTPEELLAHAKEIGLQALALTDHDTCSGLPRAEKAAAEAGIPFVRGCELSTRTERGSFHILGLWLPEQTDVLEERLSALRRRRAERNEKIVERLCTLGLPLTMEDVLICAGQGTVGRPHIAQVMVQKGYVPDLRSAFTEYLGANGRAYVPKKVFSPEEAIRLLVSTGATVSLAHPCIHHYPSAWLFERIRMLAAERGIQNILLRMLPSVLPGQTNWASESVEEVTITENANPARTWAQATAMFACRTGCFRICRNGGVPRGFPSLRN